MDFISRNASAQHTTRRYNPRVDLTAMVDLGFLLITFFMLANTLGNPRVMEVYKPTGEDGLPFPESKSLTLMLGSRDIVYSYTLDENEVTGIHLDSFSFAAHGLRARIMQRQKEVEAQYGNRHQLYVIIKPLAGSAYKHLIDVLDEMIILKVKRYAIVNPNMEVDSIAMRLIGEKFRE